MTKKVIIPAKYLDFADVFSKKLGTELLEHFDINKHTIVLESGKQSFYRLIYSLELVELKIIKTYIKNNLANCFI